MSMTVIKVKYLQPSVHRGGRLQASSNGFKAVIPYPHEENPEGAAFLAVRELVKRYSLEWDTETMTYGVDSDGIYYFTFGSCKTSNIHLSCGH